MLQVKKVIKAKLGEGVYNKMLLLLEDPLFEIMLDDGEVIDVFKIEEMPKVAVDSFMIIRRIVEGAGGRISKQELYETYVKEANCSQITAERHLQKALGHILVEDGYFHVKTPEYLDACEEEDIEYEEEKEVSETSKEKEQETYEEGKREMLKDRDGQTE